MTMSSPSNTQTRKLRSNPTSPNARARRSRAPSPDGTPSSTTPPLASDPAPTPSINSILDAHGRDNLYVDPIIWTSRQPRLLGCSFVAKELQRSGADGDLSGREDGGEPLDGWLPPIAEIVRSLRRPSPTPTPSKRRDVRDLVAAACRLQPLLYFLHAGLVGKGTAADLACILARPAQNTL